MKKAILLLLFVSTASTMAPLNNVDKNNLSFDNQTLVNVNLKDNSVSLVSFKIVFYSGLAQCVSACSDQADACWANAFLIPELRNCFEEYRDCIDNCLDAFPNGNFSIK